MLRDTKVLYGVCGIGMGHTIRQLPILDHFAASSRVVLFAYGESLRFYTERYRGNDNVTVVPVSVPFYPGGANGIDFAASAARPGNGDEDAFAINCRALATAQALLGRPDLVISDYEPTAAQYAYSQNAPLVTIDQQSKYLIGEFAAKLGGETVLDEVQRLRMFFPKADARIACSFFRVPVTKESGRQERVQLQAPIISAEVRKLDPRKGEGSKDVLVYLSSQREFRQSIKEIVAVLASSTQWTFHIVLPAGQELPCVSAPVNVAYYNAGDFRFHRLLERCAGIISTAGHSLLSEAMYLGKPVFALPLPVYEQQVNAHIIDVNGFGIAESRITGASLRRFLRDLPDFAGNIADDKTVLMRGSGEDKILAYLTRKFLR
jgi:uncharacterized protein (TIGR00661 family)